MSKNVRNSLLLFTFLSFGFIESAQAYLDPSTGSMLLSALIGVFATLGLVVKTYWYKLKSLFRKTTQEQNKEQ
ncbi:uncharacterized protein METZ01_LOCUS78591 [marine metagenome]|uniref:Uncharacterized protein n=1 Tax=marine metagenome TaxID=408172 RepID=A0A381UEH4_9ZZZZ|tara:strand:+ start:517 stop:735 length:219 start_codon:yes stop_codon:yes gene_type:complete